MPGDEDYINLGRLIIPLVLNYCQCMLELEEYYEVIEHTTELLDKHKGTVGQLVSINQMVKDWLVSMAQFNYAIFTQ